MENTNIISAFTGFSVAGAGDVNGDGYSDIIVGATGYQSGQNTPGSAFVFYGNNGKGSKNNVRLLNNDMATPINHNQFNQPNFVATLFTKSFIGNNKGKFVWETMAPGVPFSKTGNNPIGTSTQFTGSSPNYANLTVAGSVLGANVLKTGIATKIRVRVRYSPVLAITGQMYGPWRYLQSQLAGYNNAPVPEETAAEVSPRKAHIHHEDTAMTIIPYPNPVSDRLYFNTQNIDQIHSVGLLTSDGKSIYRSQNPAAGIDVRHLDPGMYLLLVTRKDGSRSLHKVVVKK